MNWCLYMMVADAGDGTSFCKIGVTGSLADRVRTIQVGCPLPINEVAYMDIRSSQGFRAERAMHDALAEYNTQGEWFRLNLTDPKHKADFAAATADALRLIGLSETRWKRMNVEAVQMLCRALRLDKAA